MTPVTTTLTATRPTLPRVPACVVRRCSRVQHCRPGGADRRLAHVALAWQGR